MPVERINVAAPEPSSLDGRLLVEITSWAGSLHVGLSSSLTPPEYRFQGGLAYVRDFEIHGRILAPEAHRSRLIRVWPSPFGPEMFGPDEMDQVGQIHLPSPQKPDFRAHLMVPEAAFPGTATCLAAIWKYLHIWTFDEDAERASVSAFSFSSTVRRSLDARVAED